MQDLMVFISSFDCNVMDNGKNGGNNVRLVVGKKNSGTKIITGGGQMSGEGGQLVETVVCGYGVDTWWFCSWSPTVAVWSLTFFFLIASRRWRSQIRPELGWSCDRLSPTTLCR